MHDMFCKKKNKKNYLLHILKELSKMSFEQTRVINQPNKPKIAANLQMNGFKDEKKDVSFVVKVLFLFRTNSVACVFSLF